MPNPVTHGPKKKENQAQGQQINLGSETKNEIQIFNNVNYVSAHYKSQISPVLLGHPNS